MASKKEDLLLVKERMKSFTPVTPWDEIVVNGVYHIPPIKTLSRRDFIILEKTDDSLKYRRIDDGENKEGDMARTSVYAKVMIKKKTY
jgi:hypothetical protein